MRMAKLKRLLAGLGVLWLGATAVPAQSAAPAASPTTAPSDPAWVQPMRRVRAAHPQTAAPAADGVYVAQFGDSITYTMAFWTPLNGAAPEKHLPDEDGLPARPPGDKRWSDLLRGFRDKGREQGNYSGWRVGDVLKAVPGVLAAKKPAIALVMVGTNDITGGRVPPTYAAELEKIVDLCTKAGCVPILSTIPPRKGLDEPVDAVNKIIGELAARRQVPLIDFHAEILRRQPGQAWLGTLISGDGVHPTAGALTDFSDENLSQSGYALRTWMSFLAVRQVYYRVIAPTAK